MQLIGRQEYLKFTMLTRQAYYPGKCALNINFYRILVLINWLEVQKIIIMPIIIN